jgi:predicted ATP-dependent protease
MVKATLKQQEEQHMDRTFSSFEVPPDRLRARCNPASFSFTTTGNLPAPTRLIGQDRAAEALEFGLSVLDSHYNIFIAGPPGSGRSAAADFTVKRAAERMPPALDWCYVYNFENAISPKALSLPAGLAHPFARDVAGAIDSLRRALRVSFDGNDYRMRRDAALEGVEHDRAALQAELEIFAEQNGFTIHADDEGDVTFLPIKQSDEPGGEPHVLSREEFAALTDDEREEMERRFNRVREFYLAARGKARELAEHVRAIVVDLDKAFAREVVIPHLDPLRERYGDLPAVVSYLNQMQEDVIANAVRLAADDGRPQRDEDDGGVSILGISPPLPTRYRVLVIVDHTNEEHAPVIREHNPSYYNLAGKLEYGSRMGNLYTDFTFLKAGSLHQANGGFLTIHLKDLLQHPRGWEVLKRVLRTGELAIENLSELQQTVASLKPEPIPMRVKIILLGELDQWNEFFENDPDFGELFKVRADFEDEMPRNAVTESYYAQFTGDVAREMGLPPLDRGAVARIIEEGSRLVDDQTKLTTSLSDVRDLTIEAGHWAQTHNEPITTAVQVDFALNTRRRRLGIYTDRVSERLRQGAILITTSGAMVGQVNGVGVLSPPKQEFARPLRITARTSLGSGHVIAIERETRMSGPVFHKGVLTITGYLRGQFGQDYPLSLNATIATEQEYNGIDGDSASLAELCALLSALAGVPVRQNLAVTGSVNQWGEVQTVGGVTLKVEGFFDACQLFPQDGTQGVIIPETNIRNLMLRPDVVEAVRAGKFHVYAVKHVNEAIELLMDRPAGSRGADGLYPLGTVNALAEQTLRVYADRARQFRQHLD